MGIEWEGSEVDDDNPHEGLGDRPGIPVTTSLFIFCKQTNNTNWTESLLIHVCRWN